MRKVTLALLAAASRSMVGSSLSSSIGVPGVNGDVSRETSTPASAAARDTASRTATAASSSTASSSGPGSIPSPPPADVSRETSTLRGLVGVSRKSTSPASVCRVTVDVFESPLESTPATAEESTTALCQWPGSGVDPAPICGSQVVTSTNSGRGSTGGESWWDAGRPPNTSGHGCWPGPSTFCSSAVPCTGAADWSGGVEASSVSLARASDLGPKRRGQVGSGFGRGSPSRSSSLRGAPPFPRSDGAMPGGNAIGRAGSFHRSAIGSDPGSPVVPRSTSRRSGSGLRGTPKLLLVGPRSGSGEPAAPPTRACCDAISSAHVSASERSPGPSTGPRRAAG
jgi:hypothetical protein